MKPVTRSRLAVVALAVSAVFLSACGRASNQTASPVASASPNYVYLDLTGDPKLVHRFRMYAEDEFEDAGLALTNDPKQASVTVNVELSSDSRTTEIGNGLVEIVATAGGVKTDLTQCGSSTSDPNGAVFDSGANPPQLRFTTSFLPPIPSTSTKLAISMLRRSSKPRSSPRCATTASRFQNRRPRTSSLRSG
jgi:hypothetical protein